MLHSPVRPSIVISNHQRQINTQTRGVHQHHGQALLMQLDQMLRWLSMIQGQQAAYQFGSQDAVNNLTIVFVWWAAVKDSFIGSVFDYLCDPDDNLQGQFPG